MRARVEGERIFGYDADIGAVGELGAEGAGEVVVQLDGDEAGGAGGEVPGERAASGADFEDMVVRLDGGGLDDSAGDAPIREKILSEPRAAARSLSDSRRGDGTDSERKRERGRRE